MSVIKFCICNSLVIILLALQAEGIHKIDLGQQYNGFFEGDIKLPKNRNGILASQKWTDGIVYYEFRDTWSQSYLDMLAKSMKEIEDHTCIKFKPRVNEKNYVRIINSSYGCNSEGVGMQGNRQDLSLSDSERIGTCWYHSVIVHELLHAVGLWHEQVRYDRDDYVTILWDNVQQYAEHNFNITYQNESYTYGLPYDYLSVMHYSKTAFGKKGSVTIQTKDPAMADQIGQEEGGSENDYEKIRRIYGCRGSYPKRPTPAFRTTVMPTTTRAPQCEDKITYCAQQLDACKTQSWTKEHCRQTCGFCSTDCKDTIDYCARYASSCETEGWMKDYCKKTCKLCEPF